MGIFYSADRVIQLIYWSQMIIFTQSLVPLTLSTGIIGLILLFSGFKKEIFDFKDPSKTKEAKINHINGEKKQT
jgi:putative effector of murein hydrolase LrgA (UPF0299 family)